MKTPILALALTFSALVPAAQDGEPWTGALSEAEFAALHELKEGAAPALAGEDVDVAGARCYLSLPDEGALLGGVVVIHEWWGLNDHVKHWADRLASDGYAALAVDLYGGTVATTPDGARAAMDAVKGDEAAATIRAAHDFLTKDPRVKAERTASIGWCFGGAWSLRTAMATPELDAAVVYYGRLETSPEKLAAIQAPVLGVFGDRDRSIPGSVVDEFAAAMEEAGRDLTLRRYDADHAFANPSSARYDAANAAAAWLETRSFLCEHLWPEDSRPGLLASKRALRHTAPAGWSVEGERNMRLATLTPAPGVECYVSAFPGDVGGLQANLNRWGTQMGGVTFEQDAIDALPRLPILGSLAHVVRIDGPYTPRGGEPVEHGTMLAAIAPRGDETVFVKLLGPTEQVEPLRAGFEAFCRSLR